MDAFQQLERHHKPCLPLRTAPGKATQAVSAFQQLKSGNHPQRDAGSLIPLAIHVNSSHNNQCACIWTLLAITFTCTSLDASNNRGKQANQAHCAFELSLAPAKTLVSKLHQRHCLLKSTLHSRCHKTKTMYLRSGQPQLSDASQNKAHTHKSRPNSPWRWGPSQPRYDRR